MMVRSVRFTANFVTVEPVTTETFSVEILLAETLVTETLKAEVMARLPLRSAAVSSYLRIQA